MGLHLPIMLIPEYLLDTAALPLLQYMIIFRVVQQSMAHSTVLGIILLGCFLDLFFYILMGTNSLHFIGIVIVEV